MKLDGKIGLVGGVAIVVGGVIGLGVYKLIPSIAASAGGATWLAILIAMIISLIGVMPIIQLSSALPVAGGGYLWGSRLLHPLVGSIVSNWAVIGGSASVCLVSSSLAYQILPLLPFEISVHALSILLVLSFIVIYVFGLKIQASLQIILSIQMLLALGLYILFAYINSDVQANISTEMTGNFGFGVLLAFNVCFGFQIVTELGEEMRNPQKNIPLALGLGALIILIVYIGLTIVYISLVGPDIADLISFKEIEKTAPLIASGKFVMPGWAVHFLWIGAISAGLTSYNAGAIAIPRELFSQARDKALPSFLCQINPRTKSPFNAVIAFFIVVICILLFGQLMDWLGVIDKKPFNGDAVDFYGFFTVCGIMLLTIFSSVAAFKLPAKYPEQYKNAYLKFPKPVLYFLILLSLISSVAFVAFLFIESVLIAIAYLVITIAIILYYYYRKKQLAKQGIKPGTTHNILSDN